MHKEFIRISYIVEKCWKIAFHMKVGRKHGSLVVSALAFSAIGHGQARKTFGDRTCFP